MKIPKVISTSNPHIKDLMKVRENASANDLLIEGPHLLETAIAAKLKIREILFTQAFASQYPVNTLFSSHERATLRVYIISDQILRKLSGTEQPQGVIARLSLEKISLSDLNTLTTPLVAVLDGIQDPGNVGAIIRNADAAGASCVVLLPGTCNPFMPKALRSTAGSIFHIPVVQAGVDDLTEWLRARSILLAVTAGRTGQSLFSADLRRPVAVVFGNEAIGIKKTLLDRADLVISIPIYGKAESLNVAAAAAVTLYEAARQRTNPGDLV